MSRTGASGRQGPGVAVAVVSWNTRELLMRCLASLHAEVTAGRVEVWVVDNGSSDGSREAVRDGAPWARLLTPAGNLGFGAAVNLVAGRTAGEWLVCANADVELCPGALRAMLAAAGDQRTAAVAPMLVSAGGGPQHSIHSLPTLSFTLALNLGLHALSRAAAARMLLEGRYDPLRARTVPWAYGACLLLRRRALEQVGGFDEAQWMYAEDLDLCWRLGEQGWLVRYEPGARVRHAGGAATAQAFGSGAARTERFMEATYRTIARRRGAGYAAAVGAVNVLGAAVRVAWMSVGAAVSPRWRGPRSENLMWMRAHRRGLRAARRPERSSS